MDSVLITGVNGFVGRNLYNALKDYYSVTGLDVNKNDSIDQMLICDITKAEDLKICLQHSDFDYVIHCAALAHNDKGLYKPEDFYRINTQGTINLLNCFKNTPIKKFIFLSSVSVYGEHNYDIAIDESWPANPISEYADSKLKAEKFIVNQKEISWIILRMPVIYAENFMKDINKRTPFKNFSGLTIIFKPGNGMQKFSFCNIANLSEAICNLIINQYVKNEIIHIADAISYNTNDLILRLKNKCKKPVIIRIPESVVFIATYTLGILLNKRKLQFSNYWKLCRNNQYSVDKALFLGLKLNETMLK